MLLAVLRLAVLLLAVLWLAVLLLAILRLAVLLLAVLRLAVLRFAVLRLLLFLLEPARDLLLHHLGIVLGCRMLWVVLQDALPVLHRPRELARLRSRVACIEARPGALVAIEGALRHRRQDIVRFVGAALVQQGHPQLLSQVEVVRLGGLGVEESVDL